MRDEEGDPSSGDAFALAPLSLAAEMVGLSIDELQSRAQVAGALRNHPRGKLIRIIDAHRLAAPPRPPGRPRKEPKAEPNPEQGKRRKRIPTPYAHAGCELMNIDEVAGLLGLDRDELIRANGNRWAIPVPALYRIKGRSAFGSWGYPRKETLEWIAEHGDEARAFFEERRRQREMRWTKPMVATAGRFN